MTDETREDGEWNIQLKQNATFSRTLTLTDSNSAAVDLTGYSLVMVIREEPESGTILATPTVTETDLANGQFTVSLTAAQTKALKFDKAYHDVVLVNGSTRTPYLYGTVTLNKAVGR